MLDFFKSKKSKYINRLGPGIITGASDDDPSGIATYSQAGSQFGFGFLWSALFSFPLMVAVQEMCGRVGLVTGSGLAGVIKKYYSKTALYFCVFLLFFANSLNIGADLGAMASSMQLLIPLPFTLLNVFFALLIIYLEIKIPYSKYKSVLKYLTFSLFAYFLAFILIKHDAVTILKSTFVPNFSFTKEYFLVLVAILGTSISPYLFFWQAGEEVEELVETGRIKKMGEKITRVFKKDIVELRLDTILGMFFSNIVMYFIIATTASTLFTQGIHTVETATDAAIALKPLGGELSYLLFVFGILGTGFLSIPVLAGSVSYAIAETLGIKEGLYNNFSKAKGFYITIAFSTFLGLFVNLIGVPPFLLLFYSAVLNGVISPILLIFILLIANNKNIMRNYTNSLLSNIGGIVTIVVMSLSVAGLLYFTFVK